MPITTVHWRLGSNAGDDIHVLHGQSTRDLIPDLLFDGQPARDYLTTHDDVQLEFRPLFTGMRTGQTFSGHGLHVDTLTGRVTVDATLPLLRKHNFIIEIVATNADGSVRTELIRVHVHARVVDMWVTPNPLTVRRRSADGTDDTRYRFSVRAQFDDGTLGDLTYNHGVTWWPSANFHEEEGEDGLVTINPEDTVGAAVRIEASLPASLGGFTATGTIIVAPAWSDEPSPPTINLVTGGGWPGTLNPERVPNVLFLGDGFTQAERPAFVTIVERIVQHLKTSRLTRPFDLLASSINFWRVFVPASAPGISFRAEVYTVAEDNHRTAVPLPRPLKHVGDREWTLSNLLYAVGLPVPADSSAADVLREQWRVLVDPALPDDLDDEVIQRWQRLATRSFIDEVDNFPGMAVDRRPAAGAAGNDLRLDGARDEWFGFWETLESDDGFRLAGGKNLGQLWAPPHTGEPEIDKTFGGTIVTISAQNGGRANAFSSLSIMSPPRSQVYLSMGRLIRFPIVRVADRNALRFDPASHVAVPSVGDLCRTAAHELGHCFGLEDEYVEFGSGHPRASRTDRPSPEFRANVQMEGELRDATGALDGDEIYWNWQRVRKAAVITDPIKTVPGTTALQLPVRQRDARQFLVGDMVFVRRREAGKALEKAKANLQTVSTQLKVVSPRHPDAVLVGMLDGSPFAPSFIDTYVPGSLLFMPVLAPESVRTDDYRFAEMVAKNIKDYITSTHEPLYRQPLPGQPFTEQIPNLPEDVSSCAEHQKRIVGLYEGGGRYAYGVFHPTGTCMMNESFVDHTEFCAVCRYIMVDLINPFYHYAIDRDYESVYPLNGNKSR